jgi:hypothetical protein
MKIELLNGKWTVNGKLYHELSPSEILILDNFFEHYKNGEVISDEFVQKDSFFELVKHLAE